MKKIIRILLLLLVVAPYSSSLHARVKKALVCGAGGFIGGHLVKRLKKEGFWVRGVDIKYHEFCPSHADEFIVGDLRNPEVVKLVFDLCGEHFDEVYQLAADMGGMGFISYHDAQIMHNSALINLNVLEWARKSGAKKIFYSSSACIYPERNQLDPDNPLCSEESAYPAAPDTEYGWEKLFSERLYLAYAKDHNMQVRIARFHNVFGPEGTWDGGREKAPAALSRKVAQARDGGTVEVWGKGDQTRSFLYIDECLDGMRKFMDSDFAGPLNIGSEEMISINNLVRLVARTAGKKITIENVPGPEGVRGRNSDNRLIMKKLGWQPTKKLADGISNTYKWIEKQVKKQKQSN